MPIDETTLIQRLQSLAPFEDATHARRAYDATLKALRRGLTDDEADWLAIDLGPALARPLEQETHAGQLTPDELYRWTGHFSGVRRGAAREQVQVVCRTLTELLSPGALQRLHRHAPELKPLFSVPESEAPLEGPHVIRSEPAADHTLAGGKPGSERPLSTATGPKGLASTRAPAVRPHSHSVADSPDPHGDTKLSSARGRTQEREHSSLSSAHHGVGKA